MDQGAAALTAGVAGMVGALGGALAGGIAAVRGARIGAETAATATRQQVQDQAAADHEHWLRGQRQDAYAALLSNVQIVRKTVMALVTALYIEQRRDDQLHDLQQSVRQLGDAVASVALLGPDDVLGVQQCVIDRCLQLEEKLLTSFVEHETDREGISDALDAFDQAAADFVVAARKVLSLLSGRTGTETPDDDGQTPSGP